jgi:alkanesulfonate monooxygenase SsuD/methylene tetrahydromethanopterin reductase-like flavin-dependent oxidoreductase (luciferase family)
MNMKKKLVRWGAAVGVSLAMAAVATPISAAQITPDQLRDLQQSLKNEAKRQLEELKQLLASGAISKDEFNERRAQILETQNVFNGAFVGDPDRLIAILQRLIDSDRTGPIVDAILQKLIDKLSPA